MAELTFISALERGITKAAPPLSVDMSRGWFPVVRESFAGAWQRNREVRADTALSNPTLFRCVSLIANDVAKMRCRLVRLTDDGIWVETDSPSFSPVLRKPNHYQNRIQFFKSWMLSKLLTGNTYVLKERDNRGVVVALYVLDPTRVRPLVSPDGSVFYQVSPDWLAGVETDLPAVPASEIIHDRGDTPFHPLVGVSPIYAAGLIAVGATDIHIAQAHFFRNGSKPGGILSSDQEIGDDKARALKARWDENYTGDNAGKVAVLGNGLTYSALSVAAVDAQLVEQLKWGDEKICGAFGVPAYKAGVGQAPLNNNVASLNQQYYGDCLQPHIEAVELCLDEGLGIGLGTSKEGVTYGTEFDTDDLIRMDPGSMMEMLDKGKNTLTPNEARKRLNLPPVEGGKAVYRQQQDYSLEALAKRDAKEDPFAKSTPPAEPPAANDDDDEERAAQARAFLDGLKKGLA